MEKIILGNIEIPVSAISILVTALVGIVAPIFAYKGVKYSARVQAREDGRERLFNARLEAYTRFWKQYELFITSMADLNQLADLWNAITNASLVASPRSVELLRQFSIHLEGVQPGTKPTSDFKNLFSEVNASLQADMAELFPEKEIPNR